jgi:hypothetical protein
MRTGLCRHRRAVKGPLECWSDIVHYYYEQLPLLSTSQDGKRKSEPRWLFRGDSSDRPELSKEVAGPVMRKDYEILDNALQSHLDKAFKEFGINRSQDKHEAEWGLMRTFRRKAHLYTGHRDDDWLERLGLMAHYGAPHRMLDWNYSFFNAMYFAVNSSHFEDNCIIWALNKAWIGEEAKRLEGRVVRRIQVLQGIAPETVTDLKRYRASKSPRFEAGVVHFLMLDNGRSAIYPVTPYHANERLSIQQGTFICPGTLDHTWGGNLREVLLKDGDPHALVAIPISLTKLERCRILRELDSMNINQATLFPDLGGFAQSLRTRLADPDRIKQEVPPLECWEI